MDGRVLVVVVSFVTRLLSCLINRRISRPREFLTIGRELCTLERQGRWVGV